MNTEDLNRGSRDIDNLAPLDIVSLMNDEDLAVVNIIRDSRQDIAQVVEMVVSSLRRGGRLIYVGAGTSGRLGVLDASEMVPTFGVSPDLVRAVIAGGREAVTRSVEGAEDDTAAGIASMADTGVNDFVLGITASGRTPFVIAALREAGQRSALTCLLTCNDIEYDFLDKTLKILVGPEIVAGSTRLKSGTATKMVLNMISTAAMIRLGHVYRGYMIDVVPSNDKLVRRARHMIRDIAGCTEIEAADYLAKAGNNPKTAVLMYLRQLDFKTAAELIERSGGALRKALTADL
ncbi:MAG: N-acetylmuramic acid 6-phosphate etherase [Nitrospira sp.]|nr:N-acetylmuramic acid 6-phosphate etherase [bacterium]MBL7048732.1 N-acetylmuramic acid 6-phosphate etherase [Nitrospira sp.]